MSGADYTYPLARYMQSLTGEQAEKYEEFAKNFFDSLPRVECKLVAGGYFEVQPRTDNIIPPPILYRLRLDDLNENYNQTKR